MADDSWMVELGEFIEDIRRGRPSAAGLADAIAALEVVDRIYKASGLSP
jgi:predicted dehydrogenase